MTTPPTTLDQLCADAKKRLAAYINRLAAQQMRRMRESWEKQ